MKIKQNEKSTFIYARQNYRGGYRGIIGMKIMKEVGAGPEKDGYQVIEGTLQAHIIVGLDQVQEQILIWIG